MRFEFLIGWRYLATKRKEKFISLISVISILGVAIGVMALIVVIAVMTGFDNDLRDKIVGNYSHITVTDYDGITAEAYAGIRKLLESQGHVTGISPYVQGQVMLQDESRFFAVGLRGIDPLSEPEVTRLNKYMLQGALSDLKDKTVIIGKELSAYAGKKLGSKLSVYSPQGETITLTVAGIFRSGMYDYDLNLIFTDIKTAQGILGVGHQYSAIAVKLDNLYLADKVRGELTNKLGLSYTLRTWMEANQNFFAALKLEKFTMFIILTLIILVASFNIISTLVVMVVEKTKDIGILKALGASSNQIRVIFTYQGFLIGGLGTFLGVAGGITLCLLLKKYQFVKLPQDIYYIERLPVSIAWSDIAFVVLSALGITLLSTIYPALKASRLQPVEALRYE